VFRDLNLTKKVTEKKMADLYGLPIPTMDWDSADKLDSWRKFKKLCNLMFKGPLEEKEEETQLSYLQIWLGVRGREICDSFEWSEAEEKNLEGYFNKFEQYLTPKGSKVIARFRFNQRIQSQTESFDSFVRDLQTLANDCGFGEAKNDLIRDRILFGCQDERLREKLLGEGDTLTFTKAYEFGRAREANQTQQGSPHIYSSRAQHPA
jgi:hypothetical protein